MKQNLNFNLIRFNGKLPERPVHSTSFQEQYFEVFLFEKAQGSFNIDFNEFSISDYSLFFLLPSSIHALSLSPVEPLKGWVLQMEMKYFGFLVEDFQVVFCPILSSPALRISASDYSFLENLLLQIKLEEENHNIKTTEALNAYFRLFYIQLERLKQVVNSNISVNQHLMKFQHLLENNFRRIKTVEQFAQHLFISPKQLNRLCLQFVHKNASRLIDERINLEAMRLLVHEHHSIKEIAHHLGYEDPAYFHRFFKRINQVTPQQFRLSMSEKYNYKLQ